METIKNNGFVNNREFEDMVTKVAIFFLTYQEKPIHGRILKETTNFVTVRMKNGSVINLSKTAIVSVQETYNQPPPDKDVVV